MAIVSLSRVENQQPILNHIGGRQNLSPLHQHSANDTWCNSPATFNTCAGDFLPSKTDSVSLITKMVQLCTGNFYFSYQYFYSSKLWSSQLWTQFKQLRIEAWKSQDFNGVWTRDLAIPVRRSDQLSYKATHVGSWSFVSSNEPVKNGCDIWKC